MTPGTLLSEGTPGENGEKHPSEVTGIHDRFIGLANKRTALQSCLSPSQQEPQTLKQRELS